ncbi:MAG: metal-dependent phosphohydrolase [Mycobacteriales bacterium]
MDDLLLQPWTDLLGDSPEVRQQGRALLARYAEPHRRYHDRRHLSEVLEALQSSTAGVAAPAPVLCAAYWHDAVYDPTRTDNEERSAGLAATVLGRLGLAAEDVAEVVRLVLLTATHDPAAGDDSGALLCDADLAVLASPPARYRAYAEAVRREYVHLDDGAFRSGRVAVLGRLAARPRLFTGERAHRRWDAVARRNLHDELARLGAAPPP